MSSRDISRFLKQPGKRYAGVRLQQGRILSDADFNENAWLREEDRRRGVVDFVGLRGTPDMGFSICKPLDLAHPAAAAERLQPGDALPEAIFWIGSRLVAVRPVSVQAGSFYLGGRRFEIEKPQPFVFQRDFLQMGPADIPAPPDRNDQPFKIAFVLNGWEQDVGAVEDAEFREPALGGSETSVRIRRMRRVEARSVPNASDCHEAFSEAMATIAGESASFDEQTGEVLSQGRLQLIYQNPGGSSDCGECNPRQEGPYLGADNQTLRIMQTDADHFVWAMDNAAPLYRAKVTNLDATTPSNVRITLLTPPPDEEHFPLIGRVVEILPFAALLDDTDNPSSDADASFNKAAAEIGAFTRVAQSYDPRTQSFLVAPNAPGIAQAAGFVHVWDSAHPDADRLPSPLPTSERFVYIRFWHVSRADDLSDIELAIDASGNGPVLESTSFQPLFWARGRRGDFWTATLRPETPDRIIPIDLETNSTGMPPDGPRHFYTPLAFVQIDPATSIVRAVSDCRPRLRPLGDDHCSTVTVGNCFGSVADFTSIADAIAALPSEGGVVTIRPGLYRERIVIDRPGVILEGCGENTVLLSPDNVTGSALIRLEQNCDGSQVRSMRIEAAEESAIIAEAGNELGFSALHIVGRVTEVGSSSSSSTTTATTDVPLVVLTMCNNISLQAVQVDAERRPGLHAGGCRGLRAEALSFLGAPYAYKAPAEPMITLRDCFDVKMRNVVIKTFGQVGVSLQGHATRDIEFSKLDIVSSHSNKDNASIVQQLPAVDIDGSTLVRLCNSHITMTESESEKSFFSFSPHAAVVVLGSEIWIEDNEIRALDASEGHGAWGGIQLRGNSSGIVVRGNRISGGIGHGITLGSVVWTEVGDSSQQLFNLGAGTALATYITNDGKWGVGGDYYNIYDGAHEFQPQDEGVLSDIAILNNRIEGMNANGISALTVLGLPSNTDDTDRDLPHVERLRIDGNTITGNVLRYPFQPSSQQNIVTEANPRQRIAAEIQSLPFGGIVLATVGDTAEIRNNVIGSNTGFASAATNGIFILNGEGISIIGNRIQGNSTPANDSETPQRGVRAGIAIMLAGTGAPSSWKDLESSMLAGGNDLASDGLSVRILDNVVMHPEGRALHIISAGPVLIKNNFFSSQGFHGSENAEDQFAIGDVVLVENVGGPWERFDIAEDTGSYRYNMTSIWNYLKNTVTNSPRFFVGVGGQVLFHNNQVVYDWTIQRVPTATNVPLGIFPIALLTLDHLSVVGNHLSLHIEHIPAPALLPRPDPALPKETGIRATPMLAHLFAAAGTLEISANRVAGSLIDTLLSIWGMGEMSTIMTSNQTTLANFARTNKGDIPDDRVKYIGQDNQVMFSERLLSDDENFTFFHDTLHVFFRLLFRPASTGLPPAPPT